MVRRMRGRGLGCPTPVIWSTGTENLREKTTGCENGGEMRHEEGENQGEMNDENHPRSYCFLLRRQRRGDALSPLIAMHDGHDGTIPAYQLSHCTSYGHLSIFSRETPIPKRSGSVADVVLPQESKHGKQKEAGQNGVGTKLRS